MSEGVLSRLRSEFSFMRGNLLTLIVSWLFMYFTFALVSPFESPFIEELGAPPVVIGLMGSIGAAMLSLVRVPGAYIADKYGRKQIIVTMTFSISLSYLLYIFAPDWRFVLVGMIISNLSLIYQPALQAIHADSIPPERRGMGGRFECCAKYTDYICPCSGRFVGGISGVSSGNAYCLYNCFFLLYGCSISAAFFLERNDP